MARGRMVATTIALDPEFNGMSDVAQLCFLRAVPHLDRDGLIIGQPAALWATIAPLQSAWLPLMQDIVNEWVRAGLVIVFDTKIGPVLYFDGFHKNQVGLRYDREPPSRLPLPDGYERTADGIRQVSGNLPASIRQPSGKMPQQVEVEVEVEVEDKAAATAATGSPAFSAWLDNMPGTMTPYYHDQLSALVEQHGDRDVVKAIGIACERGKRTLSYVRGILERGVDSPAPKSYKNGANNGTHRQDVEEVDDYDPEFAKRFAEHQARVREQRAAAEASVSLQ